MTQQLGLCSAHDRVATKDFARKSPELVEEETNGADRIVKIRKTKGQPLGATIRVDDVSRDIVINRVLYGTAAYGLLRPGDIINELNGVVIKGCSLEDVCYMLERQNGTVKFRVVCGERMVPMESSVFVMAHFDYDPRTDSLCPCKEAGIDFRRGDVLRIVDQQDPKWWQAVKEGSGNSKSGLIPSKQLQERRMSVRVADDNVVVYKKPTRVSWWKRWRSRKSRKASHSTEPDLTGSELMTYEEVAKMGPPEGKLRPVVLIGAPGVGRSTLKGLLIESDSHQYSFPVPTTSRTRKAAEVDGMDYDFMSKAMMLEAIQHNQFVEFGEHKKNYYGTSLQSIRHVVDSGKICVLTVHPQALRILKATDLKPFVAFIKPPHFEQLRETRRSRSSEERQTTPLTDDDLWELMQTSKRIYDQYGHYADCTIINDDVDRACNELKQHIERIQREPQWVPAVWIP
ncbi:MAGUK p55 subfamily member 7-like isoform X2 [Corticium candelabrum]|uniref:MAGUK p55 subfamily member 7-like isoform X2 n=1 Tax=Corticium candelabrum TaxID=121492 RepID=UPI002E25AF1E|nr:MAGUK p55 subfamily member 7-like isoform X2 [Corticium candelabrum]